jgi:hypothetical protein
VWVHVKTKTTDKRTRNVTQRKWGFRATGAGVVLGSAGAECDITVDDPALSPQHVRIALADDGDGVLLTALGRTYLLIGQGSRSGQCVPLEREQVVKMGACSLAVVDTVLSVAERQARLAAAAAATAAAKAGAAAAAAAAAASPPPSSSDSRNGGGGEAPAAAAGDDDFVAGASTRARDGSSADGDGWGAATAAAGGGGDGVRRPPLHPAATIAPAAAAPAAAGHGGGRAHSQFHMSSVSLPPPGLRARAASAMSEDDAYSSGTAGGGGANGAAGGGGRGGAITSTPTSPLLTAAAVEAADGSPDGAGVNNTSGASDGSVPLAAPSPPDAAVDREGVCYICFDGGEGAAAVSAVAPATGVDSESLGDPLVPSQCACRKLVHRSCLSRWIATKGSRLCSICKSKLPVDFTVDPPYVVLQVVRHMRGLHWNGEREYVVSFAPGTGHPDVVTVGSWHDCDLVLPDPSLSRNHARLHFHRGASGGGGGAASAPPSGASSSSSPTYFAVEDLGSSAGTYLKLSADRPHRIATTALPPYGAAGSAAGDASSSSVGSPGSGVSAGGGGGGSAAPGPLDGGADGDVQAWPHRDDGARAPAAGGVAGGRARRAYRRSGAPRGPGRLGRHAGAPGAGRRRWRRRQQCVAAGGVARGAAAGARRWRAVATAGCGLRGGACP